MATFVLIHGAGDAAWSWHLLAAELEARHHDVVAVDLPCDDDAAGPDEYADTVVDAIGDRRDLVVVGHSLGAFTAPLVCARVAADRLVLLAPMIPAPFSRRVAQERLGITPDEIDGGHCVALSRPGALAERLDAYAGPG